MNAPGTPLLLLWDIDGTLVASGGAGMRALRTALQTSFGIHGSLNDIDFAGRTDRWIMRQIFAKFDLPATEETFERFFAGYLEALPGEMSHATARILPGVSLVLSQASARAHIAQGLLTGNVRRGAQVKLSFHGLWDYFPFGAFADDHEHRNELGPFAVRRAGENRKVEFPRERTWIIGDTPHDIACGRAIGARTMAVATGHYDEATLRSHQPDALMSDLSDADAFWRIVDPAETSR